MSSYIWMWVGKVANRTGESGDTAPCERSLAGPEDIIKFSVMPSGKNLSLIKDYCSDFHDFLNKMIRKMS